MSSFESAAYDPSVDHFEDDVVDLAAIEAYEHAQQSLSAADVVDAIVVDAIVVDSLALDVAVVDDDALEATVVEVIELTPEIERADTKPGERHLKIAPDSVARRRRVRIAAAGAAVTISATLFAVVGFNVELAQHQIQLQHLQNQLTSEQARYYDLRKQVAESSSPGAIVAAAKRLGLTPAQTSYLPDAIPPPPADPTGTSEMLGKIHDNAGGSLDPPQ